MATDDRFEDGAAGNLDYGDAIDPAIFEQILEMDDDEEERDFSKQIVFDFFDQAKQTFTNMDSGVANRDLPALSDLGHFLKGSSATLGLVKVRDSCEKVQHLGKSTDEKGDRPLDPSTCLERIQAIIPTLRSDFADAEKRLRSFYHDETS